MKATTRKFLLFGATGLIFIMIATVATAFWIVVYKNNVNLTTDQRSYLYIPTGSGYDDLMENITQSNLLINPRTFAWLAQRKNLPEHVNPGRYELRYGMNNNELIDMLRSGAQTPLNVIFNNLRTIEQLAGVVGKQIEADSLSIIQYLQSTAFYNRYGLTIETAPTLFLPNTYEFYWNTTAEGFVERMKRENDKFWDDEKNTKAAAAGLTRVQVSTLASIVEKETNRNDEKATIAGVYLNRLRQGWKLQADPTAVYAFYRQTDSLLNRVYRIHTQIDSPYNTYLHEGLPPGPICIPSASSLLAVLNAEHHDYMFFVARPDGSGYHTFARTYRQHLNNAREHYKAINQRTKNK
jgi:UPF0755 protein